MKKTAGLTLIEVLIALAIISIALTAVIKATSQTVRSDTYLQNKTIALWVGTQVVNEARIGVLKLTDGEPLKQSTAMLGQDWYWQAEQTPTPNKHIKKVEVNVFTKADEEDKASALITLESYTYHEE